MEGPFGDSPRDEPAPDLNANVAKRAGDAEDNTDSTTVKGQADNSLRREV